MSVNVRRPQQSEHNHKETLINKKSPTPCSCRRALWSCAEHTRLDLTTASWSLSLGGWPLAPTLHKPTQINLDLGFSRQAGGFVLHAQTQVLIQWRPSHHTREDYMSSSENQHRWVWNKTENSSELMVFPRFHSNIPHAVMSKRETSSCPCLQMHLLKQDSQMTDAAGSKYTLCSLSCD